jgi:predicted secreted protein
MSASQGAIGFGTLFKFLTSTGPDVYTTIGQQTSVKPYGISVDSVDVSHEQSDSATREFIAGLVDSGEASIKILYVPAGAAESLLMSALRVLKTCRSVFPSGAYAQYSAFITGLEPDSPMDDKMLMDVKLKISGVISMVAASVPSNSISPAISGTAQVGVTLTAYEGSWLNEPTSFAYQWKKDGTNISGAVARTYQPVSGDATHAITVAVTATNSAGSATATSPATAAVAA